MCPPRSFLHRLSNPGAVRLGDGRAASGLDPLGASPEDASYVDDGLTGLFSSMAVESVAAESVLGESRS